MPNRAAKKAKKRAADDQGFLTAQRMAYQATTAIQAEIQEGWTEIQAAQMMKTYLLDHGVKSFFHEPFAWFGDRTRYDGVRRNKDFSPTHRRFNPSEPALFDVAPIIDGYIGDVGYSFCQQPHAEFKRAMAYLVSLRESLPALFDQFINDGAALWKLIDDKIVQDGFDNIHQCYPFEVLGHRVHRVPFSFFSARTPYPFSLHAFWSILSRGLKSQLLNQAHRGKLTGRWAIEPHLGLKDFGVKFEEILIVDEKGSYWLDDDVPHIQK